MPAITEVRMIVNDSVNYCYRVLKDDGIYTFVPIEEKNTDYLCGCANDLSMCRGCVTCWIDGGNPVTDLDLTPPS